MLFGGNKKISKKGKMKKIVAILMALSMMLSLVACGGAGQDSNATDSGTAESNTVPAETTEEKKTDLIIVQASDMNSFDPCLSNDVKTVGILNMVYNRLYELTDQLGAYPVLAENVEYISDTVLNIKIHEGVMFTDGTEMTSEDVQYSLLRAKEKATTAATLLSPILSVEIVDPYTVQITTDGVYTSILTAFTHLACSIVPKHYGEAADAADDWSKPVGSGRYTVVSRNIGDSVVLGKNENYWDPENGAQNDSLTFKVIPEGSNRTIMVETGEADLNIDFQTSDYNRVKSDPNLALHEHPSAMMFYLCMNCKEYEWLDNKLVRQAINYCIDREAVLLAGYDGLGTVLNTYVAPSCLGYKDNNVYSYNLDKAKELMTEAGCDGFEVELIVHTDSLQRIAEVLQGYLSQIGITTKITRIESTVRGTMMKAGEIPMCVATWACYQDPDLFLARIFGTSSLNASGYARFENDTFTELYNKAHSLTDDDERAEIYGEIQDLLVEEAPWCPLFVSTMFALAREGLQGVEINTESPFNFYKLHY